MSLLSRLFHTEHQKPAATPKSFIFEAPLDCGYTPKDPDFYRKKITVIEASPGSNLWIAEVKALKQQNHKHEWFSDGYAPDPKPKPMHEVIELLDQAFANAPPHIASPYNGMRASMIKETSDFSAGQGSNIIKCDFGNHCS